MLLIIVAILFMILGSTFACGVGACCCFAPDATAQAPAAVAMVAAPMVKVAPPMAPQAPGVRKFPLMLPDPLNYM